MVKMYLNLEVMPKLDDTTDSLACAICVCHSHKMDNY
jgi:Holliday junction resolvasome RuvABC endonuclease subunit